MKRIIIAVLASLFLLIPAMASAGTMPHIQRPMGPATATASDPNNLCLLNASNFCWNSPGGGNQAQITDVVNNYASISVVNCFTLGGFTWCEFQNAHGHCYYQNGDAIYEGSSTSGCVNNLSGSDEYFGLDPTGFGDKLIPWDYYNEFTGGVAALTGTYNDEDGKPIWAIPTGTSGWVTWGEFTS